MKYKNILYLVIVYIFAVLSFEYAFLPADGFAGDYTALFLYPIEIGGLILLSIVSSYILVKDNKKLSSYKVLVMVIVPILIYILSESLFFSIHYSASNLVCIFSDSPQCVLNEAVEHTDLDRCKKITYSSYRKECEYRVLYPS